MRYGCGADGHAERRSENSPLRGRRNGLPRGETQMRRWRQGNSYSTSMYIEKSRRKQAASIAKVASEVTLNTRHFTEHAEPTLNRDRLHTCDECDTAKNLWSRRSRTKRKNLWNLRGRIALSISTYHHPNNVDDVTKRFIHEMRGDKHTHDWIESLIILSIMIDITQIHCLLYNLGKLVDLGRLCFITWSQMPNSELSHFYNKGILISMLDEGMIDAF